MNMACSNNTLFTDSEIWILCNICVSWNVILTLPPFLPQALKYVKTILHSGQTKTTCGPLIFSETDSLSWFPGRFSCGWFPFLGATWNNHLKSESSSDKYGGNWLVWGLVALNSLVPRSPLRIWSVTCDPVYLGRDTLQGGQACGREPAYRGRNPHYQEV